MNRTPFLSQPRWKTVAWISALVALGLSVAWVVQVRRGMLGQADWGLIGVGVAAYVRDIEASNEPVPDAVVLNDLIRKGYLQTNTLAAFAGAEVTLSLRGARDGFPEEVLARAVMPNGGGEVVLLGDGSVQQRRVRR